MSAAQTESTSRNSRAKRTRSANERGSRRSVDTSGLASWLASLELGVTPSIHVNGHSFTMALFTVDFGTPLKPVKLTSDQAQELHDRMRKLARDLLNRDANIRISHDNTSGIYWASIA